MSKCQYSASLVIKQTNSIVLATSDHLKCYSHGQQCYIFLSVLYEYNSTLICLILKFALNREYIRWYVIVTLRFIGLFFSLDTLTLVDFELTLEDLTWG